MILNDLLETDFVLLADLCRHFDCKNETSGKIVELLSDVFRRLCKDLCENPSLLQVNYLNSLESFLLVDQLNSVKKMNLKVFLEHSHQTSIKEALQKRHVWNQEEDDSPNTVLAELFKTMVRQNENNFLVDILKFSKLDNFKCWRYYLMFLKHVCRINNSDYVINDMKLRAKGRIQSY